MGSLSCGLIRSTAEDVDDFGCLCVGPSTPRTQAAGTPNNEGGATTIDTSGIDRLKSGASSGHSPPRPNPSRITSVKTGRRQSNEDAVTYPQMATHNSEQESQYGSEQSASEPQLGVFGNPHPGSTASELVCVVHSKVAGSVSIHRPQMKCVENKETGVRRYVVGAASDDERTQPSYVVMLVGATGVGKSTLVNGIANYVLGVRWEDSFRYKLVTDVGTIGQAHSQTQQITSYTIYSKQGFFPSPFTVTVIDTPGFGDTEGLERDKRISEELRHFFSTTSFTLIHAIGFVTQASLPRLTPTQKYIFDSIVGIFGKDIAGNILLMATFADAKKPPVLEALREDGVPFRKCFKFNNSALYPIADDEFEGSDSSEPDDDDGQSFVHMFWNLCMKGFREFFEELSHMEARSLFQTKEVLEEREQLALITQGLQQWGLVVVARIEELKKEKTVLIKHKADIEANREFTYSVHVARHRQEDSKSIIATSCAKCHFTCHENCSCPLTEDGEVKCIAIQDGTCTVCPWKCEHAFHGRNAIKYSRHIVKEERTSEYLKRQYTEIEYEVNQEILVANCQYMVADQYYEAFLMVHHAQQTVLRLNALALKPKSFSGTECIDVLIKLEEKRKEHGYKNRVKNLQLIRSEAEKLSDIHDEKEYHDSAKKRAQQLAEQD